jgi:hypothetical protein
LTGSEPRELALDHLLVLELVLASPAGTPVPGEQEREGMNNS